MGAIIRAMVDDAPPPRPAGFWIRAVALAIDVVVFGLVQASLSAMATAMLGPAVEGVDSPHVAVILFTLLFTAVYTTVLHTVAGQTIGKSLVAIRVVDVDGAPLTLGASLLRYLSYFLSLMPLGFGYLVAALRRDKRALHDLIAGSRVERAGRPRRIVRRAAPSRASVPAGMEPARRPAGAEPEP
jgi:uncharacterized RDD family membrane protein YckC